jgi:hypothetical protein
MSKHYMQENEFISKNYLAKKVKVKVIPVTGREGP